MRLLIDMLATSNKYANALVGWLVGLIWSRVPLNTIGTSNSISSIPTMLLQIERSVGVVPCLQISAASWSGYGLQFECIRASRVTTGIPWQHFARFGTIRSIRPGRRLVGQTSLDPLSIDFDATRGVWRDRGSFRWFGSADITYRFYTSN